MNQDIRASQLNHDDTTSGTSHESSPAVSVPPTLHSFAEPRFTHAAETVSVELWPGVIRKTLGWGDRMLVAEITLLKGSVVPGHAHPHEQVGYVASGRLEFIVGDSRDVLVAGDGYIIPGNAPHSVIAHEDSVAIDIFSPVRDEYKA